MNIYTEKKIHSFSLIEVLIFITILSLFFVVAVSVLTASLRVSKINEHKILAKHYADELYEWLKSEKEQNWGGTTTDTQSTFTKIASQADGYCFNSSPITEWTTPTEYDSCLHNLKGLFRRHVVLTPLAVSDTDPYIDRVQVSIIVDWSDYGNTYVVPINSVFSVWEKTY